MSFALVLMVLGSAPVEVPAQQDLHELALSLYDQGRFAEAAARLETLADAGGPPVRRFEAGQMRFAAGHLAHAARHFQAYLGGTLSADDREIGEARLAGALAGTRAVEARLSPPGVATRLVAHRVGDPAELQRPDLEEAVTGGVAALRLDPGPWELRVEAPGYLPLRQALTVGETWAPVELRLVPVVAPAVTPVVRQDPRARQERVAGLVLLPMGAVALAGFATTVVLYGRTRGEFNRYGIDGYGCNDLAALHDLHARARAQVGAMVGLGVASAALLSAGTVLLVRGQRSLRRTRVALDLRSDRLGLTLLGTF